MGDVTYIPDTVAEGPKATESENSQGGRTSKDVYGQVSPCGGDRTPRCRLDVQGRVRMWFQNLLDRKICLLAERDGNSRVHIVNL